MSSRALLLFLVLAAGALAGAASAWTIDVLRGAGLAEWFEGFMVLATSVGWMIHFSTLICIIVALLLSNS